MSSVRDECPLYPQKRTYNLDATLNARTSLIGNRSTTVYHPGIVALDTYDTPTVLNNDYSIEIGGMRRSNTLRRNSLTRYDPPPEPWGKP